MSSLLVPLFCRKQIMNQGHWHKNLLLEPNKQTNKYENKKKVTANKHLPMSVLHHKLQLSYKIPSIITILPAIWPINQKHKSTRSNYANSVVIGLFATISRPSGRVTMGQEGDDSFSQQAASFSCPSK